jgi:hypothetical protein
MQILPPNNDRRSKTLLTETTTDGHLIIYLAGDRNGPRLKTSVLRGEELKNQLWRDGFFFITLAF